MQISLNVDNPKAVIWSIPNVAHLSFEEPGPVEVDFDQLSLVNKLAIRSGVVWKILLLSPADLKVLDAAFVAKEATPVVPVKSAPVPVPQGKSLQANREETLERVEATLKGDVTAIKKLIKSSSDMLFLRLMKEQELAGKARKGILSDIEKSIAAQQVNVVAKVGNEDVGSVKLKTGDLDDQFEVEESEFAQIELKPSEQTA